MIAKNSTSRTPVGGDPARMSSAVTCASRRENAP